MLYRNLIKILQGSGDKSQNSLQDISRKLSSDANTAPLLRIPKKIYSSVREAFYDTDATNQCSADIFAASEYLQNLQDVNILMQRVNDEYVLTHDFRNGAIYLSVTYYNTLDSISFKDSSIIFKTNISSICDNDKQHLNREYEVSSDEDHEIIISKEIDVTSIVKSCNIGSLTVEISLYINSNGSQIMLGNSEKSFKIYFGTEVSSSNEFRFRLEDNDAVLTDYTGNSQEIIIPNIVERDDSV